jgi:imidazolonepropionase-like amidohydrolase
MSRSLALAVLTLANAASAQPQVTALRAGALVGPDGELQTPGVVVFRDGRILQMGGQPPSGAKVIEFERAVLCPGLIDVQGPLGAIVATGRYGTALDTHLSETVLALQPQARGADAFDRFHRQLRAALRAGVTTFALAPDDQNVVGGRIAIARTCGPEGRPALLDANGPLKLSLSPEAFKTDREPTSRMGAVSMLRSAIADAARGASASSPGADDPLAAFAQGQLRGILTAPTAPDVLTAADLVQQFDSKLAVVHWHAAADVAAQLAQRKIGAITGPLDLFASPREALAPGILDRAGVEVAIAGGLPTQAADSLRIGAAIAARYGMSLAAARRAITLAPARFLGVDDRVGSLQRGRRADVVVFSGDPLDLRSRVLAVFVDGRRIRLADHSDVGNQ